MPIYFPGYIPLQSPTPPRGKRPNRVTPRRGLPTLPADRQHAESVATSAEPAGFADNGEPDNAERQALTREADCLFAAALLGTADATPPADGDDAATPDGPDRDSLLPD